MKSSVRSTISQVTHGQSVPVPECEDFVQIKYSVNCVIVQPT